MIPVFIIGALAALAIAAAGKKGTTLPTIKLKEPAKKATTPITRITRVRTPKAAARKKAIRRLKPAADKALAKKLKSVQVKATSPAAQEVFKRLMAMAASKKTTPKVRAAAAKKVKAIAKLPTKAARRAAIQKLPAEAKTAIAKAVSKAEDVKPTPDQAARMLYVWTKNGGNQGTKYNRSAYVKKCQEYLGLKADGIIGPNTRRRVKEFGLTLAPRSAQKKGAVGYLGGNLRRAS